MSSIAAQVSSGVPMAVLSSQPYEGRRRPMETPQAHPRVMQGVRRRDLLKTGLAAGLMLSASPLHRPLALCAAEAGQPKRGGILRVRGLDPPHFDPHLTFHVGTHTTLSFVYSK